MNAITRLFTAIALSATIAGCASYAPTKMADGVLVTDTGMTVYTFDKDIASSGKSACYGPCSTLWPAVAPSGEVSGDYGVITRDDGSKQLTYKGKPLYLFAKDKQPGDKLGDNVKDIWHVIK